MDPSRDGGGGLTATGLFCGSCGTKLTQATRPAEYKQVTVLFADVVHSMDIAAAVGSERLREIIAQLVGRAKEVFSATTARWTSSPATGWLRYPLKLDLPERELPHQVIGRVCFIGRIVNESNALIVQGSCRSCVARTSRPPARSSSTATIVHTLSSARPKRPSRCATVDRGIHD